MSLHMLGVAGPYGDLYGTAFSAAGNLLQGGLNAYDADQAKQKASAADQAKLQAAIVADAAAATAKALALNSADEATKAVGKAKDAAQAKAAADQAASDLASSTEDKAAAALPLTLAPARVDAAQKALQAATAKLQAAPTDVYAQSLVKAWQAVANKTQNAQIVQNAPTDGKAPQKPAEGWLSQKTIIKSLPNYAVVAGGAGAVGLGWLAVKKGLLHRFGIG